MRHMSYSRLKDFEVSPGYYKWRLSVPFVASPAMIFGSAVDCLLFYGPDRFDQEYIIKPDGTDLRTKAGKEWAAKAEGKKVVDASVLEVAAAVMTYEPAAELLHGGEAQKTLEWEGHAGVPMKGVADYVAPGCIVDLKTTNDPDPVAFAKQAQNLRYHWQAWLYCNAYELSVAAEGCDFFWIVAQSVAPFRVEVYRPEMAWLELAREQTDALLERYAACCEADYWPLSSGQVHTLAAPKWAWRE